MKHANILGMSCKKKNFLGDEMYQFKDGLQRQILILGVFLCSFSIGIFLTLERKPALASPAGGDTIFLPLIVKPTEPEDKIVYVSDGDLMMMNPAGLNKVNLTSTPGITEFSPAWSPDGNYIAYLGYETTEDESSVYVMNNDGSNSQIISQGFVYSYGRLVWSPDSSKLLFVSDRNGANDVFVVNRDGSNLVNLTNSTSSEDSQPDWSPDGSKIAYITDLNLNPFVYDLRVMVMDANGSNKRTLADAPGGHLSPAWSPDGSQIAFSSGRDSDAYDLFVMNADGSNQTNLTTTLDATLLGPFHWSPDGSHIMFVENNVYHIRLSDGEITNLTSAMGYVATAQWSPDGTQIIFSLQEGLDTDIYIMASDGSGVINLTNNDNVNEDYPIWSPVKLH